MENKVGILSLADPSWGGSYQYTLTLLETAKLIKDIEFVQIRTENSPKVLQKDIIIESEKSLLVGLKRALHGLTGIKLGKLISEKAQKEIKDIDLIISPFPSFIPYHMGKPYIVIIHDFQHEYFPQFFPLREIIIRKIRYRSGIYATFVVVESNFVKNDVIRFLKIHESKIRIIQSPPPPYISKIQTEQNKIHYIREKYKLPERYIFYPAQFWYHKNHIKLLEALKIIEEKYGTKIPLVLVGSKKENFDNVMRKIKVLGLENQVKYLGYVPDEDMPYLYKLATALVLPSLFESISLPIWEAFYLGTPVASSNVCALPEQVGNAGLIFDPHNPEDIAEKIYLIWSNENLRKELIRKGHEIIKNHTLEKYAEQWRELIYEALSNNQITKP